MSLRGGSFSAFFLTALFLAFSAAPAPAENSSIDPQQIVDDALSTQLEDEASQTTPFEGYKIGPDDVLDVAVLQPDKITTALTVSPDGSINFPYVGTVVLKDLSLAEAQAKLQKELSAYMQFPVVSITLRESKSRTFYVYGEVGKPGPYQADSGLTLVRAISMAGGFTKYGAAGQAVVLRQKQDGSGNETAKMNIKSALEGDASQDIKIFPRDIITVSAVYSEEDKSSPSVQAEKEQNSYKIGIDDVLLFNILQPEQLNTTLTVSPDGTVTFPYIGNVAVKDEPLMAVQRTVQSKLAAVMQNPVVSISLKESKSRIFYLYGEVAKPGPYPIQEGLTVVRAISMAGGFTKYGSANNVKVLRQKPDKSGNQTIKINLKAAMNGDGREDLKIQAGDVITVQEGIF